MTRLPTSPHAVLAFWFGLQHRNRKDDDRVRDALGDLYRQASDGALESWAEEPRARLALILLLDQAPRHLFRDRPEAYASDARAQALTARFIAEGGWEDFTPLERYFAAAPWLHAEKPALQERINPILHALAEEEPTLAPSAGIADLYRETIRRFARFPHRNAVLGRESTPEERTFLEKEWGPRRRAVYREGEDR